MKKIDEARRILKELQVPEKQQTDLCCYSLLALANQKKKDAWASATNDWLRIHDILVFTKEQYKTTYAENSRETFRKQALHHFRNAAFIEDNGLATNSPNYRYRLTEEMLTVLRSYKTDRWKEIRDAFIRKHSSLMEIYANKRAVAKLPVNINGKSLHLSSGAHNKLQKAVIEEFAPRFAHGSECLYIGDTTKRDLVVNEKRLKELGVLITVHESLPDIILYVEEKNWLYFIEAVTSVGPIDPKRMLSIEGMTAGSEAGKIFVTAFPDMKTFKKFSDSLAWETEVWIAEMPDHMIHFNGDRFIGPRHA